MFRKKLPRPGPLPNSVWARGNRRVTVLSVQFEERTAWVVSDTGEQFLMKWSKLFRWVKSP